MSLKHKLSQTLALSLALMKSYQTNSEQWLEAALQQQIHVRDK